MFGGVAEEEGMSGCVWNGAFAGRWKMDGESQRNKEMKTMRQIETGLK